MNRNLLLVNSKCSSCLKLTITFDQIEDSELPAVIRLVILVSAMKFKILSVG